MFDCKKIGLPTSWVISVFTLPIRLLVGISSKSNGVVVWYINVGAVSSVDPKHNFRFGSHRSGYCGGFGLGVMLVSHLHLGVLHLHVCFVKATQADINSIMLTWPENESDPLASSVGWVFDFDNNRKFGLLSFKHFRIHEHYYEFYLFQKHKRNWSFSWKNQQVYSSFFFPPIFLRTTVIHSKNCHDNCWSLFLSLIFVLQGSGFIKLNINAQKNTNRI
jgi:hypothetical protein